MSDDRLKVYLLRHGETQWLRTGQHTGRADIPLTLRGEQEARWVGDRLRGITFSTVVSSPLVRASRTCELAGYSDVARYDADLAEWDYGAYEGLTKLEIHRGHPGWNVFRDGCPQGEAPSQVRARADRVIERAAAAAQGGTVLLVAHGHLLRVLGARWLGLPVQDGRLLALSTGAVCMLTRERGTPDRPMIQFWNDTHHLDHL